MQRDAVIKMANLAVKRDFHSVTEAAKVFGVDRATLSLYLNNHERVKDLDVPQFLLDYLNIDKQSITKTTYRRKSQ